MGRFEPFPSDQEVSPRGQGKRGRSRQREDLGIPGKEGHSE